MTVTIRTARAWNRRLHLDRGLHPDLWGGDIAVRKEGRRVAAIPKQPDNEGHLPPSASGGAREPQAGDCRTESSRSLTFRSFWRRCTLENAYFGTTCLAAVRLERKAAGPTSIYGQAIRRP